MDQRIPDPMSCRCPEPRVGLLETPPRWHATIYCFSFGVTGRLFWAEFRKLYFVIKGRQFPVITCGLDMKAMKMHFVIFWDMLFVQYPDIHRGLHVCLRKGFKVICSYLHCIWKVYGLTCESCLWFT